MASLEFGTKEERLEYYKNLNRRRTETGIPTIRIGTVQAGEVKQVSFSERTRHLQVINTNDGDIGFSVSSTGPWADVLGNNMLDMYAEVQDIYISGSAANQGYSVVAII